MSSNDAPRHRIELGEPSATFIDSFLVGNGTLGAALRGGAGTEVMDLNLDTLWSGGPDSAVVDPPDPATVVRLRQAIAAGDHAEADRLARANLSDRWVQAYQPLARLTWAYGPTPEHVTGYRRTLDLRRATASVRYRLDDRDHTGGDGEHTDDAEAGLDVFVSAPAAVLVATTPAERGVSAAEPTPDPTDTQRSALGVGRSAVGFELHHPASITEDERDGARWVVATGRVPALVTPGPGEVVRYADDAPDAAGTVAAGMGFAAVACVEQTAEGARLLVAAECGFRGPDQRPSADVGSLTALARARVEAARGRTTADLRAEHESDHRSYYDRADLDLSASDDPAAAAAERYFHLGRYLMIAGSRPGTQPLNLQGIWNADPLPPWSCDWTTNINLPMAYWPAEPTGLADLAEPLFDLVADLADAGRRTARDFYGTRGSAVHHNTDLWRFTAPVAGEPKWSSWPSALPWLAAHLGDHLDYGAEPGAGPDAAARAALPVHRAAVEHTLGMLVDSTTGLGQQDSAGPLVVSPSSSPEHTFVRDGHEYAVDAGCAMDQELAAEVLGRFLALPAEDGAPDDTEGGAPPSDEALAARARDALERLRPVQVGPGGDLLEYETERTPGEPGHRHLSHLYGLYPGARITETRTPEHFAAAREALRLRLEHGSGYTGWSQAWILCLAARLRDPALAERSLAILIEDLSSASLLDLHPAEWLPEGWVFQIDGNLGATAGVAELLVQSHDGAVSLLPTLPPSWSAGHARGLRCRGGHVVDVAWRDGRLTEATVTAGGPRVVVDVTLSTSAVVRDEAGETVATIPVRPAASGRVRLAWDTAVGGRYIVTSGQV
ncbi:alpha-L-fucosidase 2 [Promicromonospora sp. AC04]|uniref:glycosyl hydrolase family 95 catalytic domain-containing protein n=1 Tax=Promicromonospora sp. AC04 TaxID=2135723 RepID=UPI000D3435BF|nr:glycoside hydrolase N-terminal domain-containing protein [Promicromonospora sp. AC04]PUB24510.1 alpha-L-fucosidase 2 [Promicromonospora sp. AC04]